MKAVAFIKNASKKDQNCAIGQTLPQVRFILNFQFKIHLPGQKCPMPGSLPKGKWSCEENELPILGISFLDEGAQTYPGEQLMDSGEVNSH